jgi:hypothetical protein
MKKERPSLGGFGQKKKKIATAQQRCLQKFL